MYIYILFLFFSLRYFTRATDTYLIFLYFYTFYSSTILFFLRFILSTVHAKTKFLLFSLLFLYIFKYRHAKKDTIGIIWKNNDSPTLFSHFCLWLSTGIPRTPETEQIPMRNYKWDKKVEYFEIKESCD